MRFFVKSQEVKLLNFSIDIMRLWSIHPKYLDSKGLIAVWREALLAQKVLEGNTKSYINHPQLIRFKFYVNPLKAIGSYLTYIYKEGKSRGYNFNKDKIKVLGNLEEIIEVSVEQIKYEFNHLVKKLERRDLVLFEKYNELNDIDVNPLFKTKKGEIETWEKITFSQKKQ